MGEQDRHHIFPIAAHKWHVREFVICDAAHCDASFRVWEGHAESQASVLLDITQLSEPGNGDVVPHRLLLAAH